MKLHNPWTIAVRLDDPILGMSIILALTSLFIVGMVCFPVVVIGILSAVIIGRILYAILKGK